MKKRIISFLLVLCMVCSQLPVISFAATTVASGTCGNNTNWTLADDGTLTISGTGPMADYSVSAYGPWDTYKNSITKIAIEDGITTIGSFAFVNCASVTNVEIPGSVTKISMYAFSGCSGLPNVVIPASVTEIGSNAFAYCTNLFEITFMGHAPVISSSFADMIPFTITAYYPANDPTWNDVINQVYGGSINWVPSAVSAPGEIDWNLSADGVLTISGEGAMADCQEPQDRPWNDQIAQIKSVVVSEGVTKVGARAFALANNLTSVSLASSVASIGEGAFMQCTSLGAIELPNSLTQIEGGVFAGCSSLKNIQLPISLERLGMNAFAGCTSMTELYIPASVNSLEVPVSMGSGISKIDVDGGNPNFASSDGILFNKDFTSLGYYPSAKSATSYVVPDGIILIAYGAFAGAQSLQSVELPASVQAVSDLAFAEMGNLSSVTFTGDAPAFGLDVFNLDTITAYYPANNATWIPEVMQQYGGTVTWRATSDSSEPGVTLVASGSCGDGLNWSLSSNGCLTIFGQGNMTDFTNSAPWASYSNSITSVVVKKGVTSIGQKAFYGYSKLQSVELPEGLEGIGTMAFYNCTSLIAIDIPASVIGLGDRVFYGCTSLKEIRVDKQNADFYSWSGLLYFGPTLICVPGGYEGALDLHELTRTIAEYAMSSCSKVTELTIPASIQEIGTQAFKGCSGLKKVTFQGDAPTIASDAFSNVTTKVYYPSANSLWTSSMKQRYGGRLTWTTYGTNLVAEGCCGETSFLDEKNNVVGTNQDFIPKENATWTLTSDGTMTISGEGKINDCGFMGNHPWMCLMKEGDTRLKKLVVEDGITYLGQLLFLGSCTGLKELVLPPSLEFVARGAFYGQTSLETISFAHGVMDHYLDIGEVAFTGCNSMTELILPINLGQIGPAAFADCDSLTSVKIPANVHWIGYTAFASDDNLHEILVDEYNTNFYSWNGLLYTGSELVQVPAGYQGVLDLQETTAKIALGALHQCTGITELIIPSAIQEIGEEAILGCTGLKNVTFQGNAPAIAANAFTDVTATVRYPDANTSWTADMQQNYGGALTWNTYGENLVATGSCGAELTWVLNSNGVLTISGNGAMTDFAKKAEPWRPYMNSITAVEISSGVTTIGDWAFWAYSNVTKISIPTTVTHIGQAALSGLGAIDELVIPNGVVSIAQGAFQGSGMKEIVLPASVESIGAAALINCPNLTFIRVDENNTHYSNDSNGFLYNKNKTKLIQVYGLAKGTFLIPSTVTTIGEAAIYICPFLTNITVPASVTSIEQMGLAMSGVKEIIFEGSAPTFGDYAFAGDTALIYYPAGNPTWTEDVMLQYEGTLTWTAYTVVYDVIEEGTQTEVAAGEPLTVHIDAAYSNEVAEEIEVYMNGTLVDKENYTVTSGSVIITFKPEYLATLEEGDHTVTVHFTDGIATSEVAVEKTVQTFGDLDLNGKVNSDDLTLLARHVGGIELVSGQALLNADVNGDGKVNSDDLTKHARYVGGIITDWDQD